MLHEIGGHARIDALCPGAPDPFASGLRMSGTLQRSAARDPLPGGLSWPAPPERLVAGRRIGRSPLACVSRLASAAVDPLRPAVDVVTSDVVMPGETSLPSAVAGMSPACSLRSADPIGGGLAGPVTLGNTAPADPHSGVFA